MRRKILQVKTLKNLKSPKQNQDKLVAQQKKNPLKNTFPK